MDKSEVLFVPLLVSLLAVALGLPVNKSVSYREKVGNSVRLERTLIKLYKRSAEEKDNDTSTETLQNWNSFKWDSNKSTTATAVSNNSAQGSRNVISFIRWVPQDITSPPATSNHATEIYMGAIIAVPPLACPSGYRRQAGRCRRIYY